MENGDRDGDVLPWDAGGKADGGGVIHKQALPSDSFTQYEVIHKHDRIILNPFSRCLNVTSVIGGRPVIAFVLRLFNTPLRQLENQ